MWSDRGKCRRWNIEKTEPIVNPRIFKLGRASREWVEDNDQVVEILAESSRSWLSPESARSWRRRSVSAATTDDFTSHSSTFTHEAGVKGVPRSYHTNNFEGVKLLQVISTKEIVRFERAD